MENDVSSAKDKRGVSFTVLFVFFGRSAPNGIKFGPNMQYTFYSENEFVFVSLVHEI